MPKGKYTAADLAEPPKQQGQYSIADVADANPPPPDQPGDIHHRDTRPFAERLQSSHVPLSFEGKPENVGEYYPEAGSQVVSGVSDIAHGDIAKGGHKVISGIGMALAPVAPLTAGPVALATGIGTGTLGSYVGRRGAEALGATPDQQDLAGDITGIASGAAGGAVASKVQSLPLGRMAKAGWAGTKAAVKEGASRVPIVGPATKSFFRGARESWRDTSFPGNPGEVQGPRMETGQFDLPRFDGEYVDPAPIPKGRDIPFAPSEVVYPPALPESASPMRDLIYRRGPGEVPPDPVGPPNDRVLARGAGVRTTPRGLLGEGIQPFQGPPPPRSPIQGFTDTREDASIVDAMRNNMYGQERAGLGQEARDFAAGSSADSPKWLRNAEAKAELLLQQAEQKAHAPVRYTKTVAHKRGTLAPKEPAPAIQSPDDIALLLQESIRRANAAKGGR